MRHTATERERIAGHVVGALERDGVTPEHAAFVAQAVTAELERDGRIDTLFVVKITDTTGAPHAVVMRTPSASATPLYRLDIRAMRIRARRELIADLRADLSVDDDDDRISI